MELSKMTTIEAKLDAIMHSMDKQERKIPTAHEIGAVERELMRRSVDVPTEEDSYGVEEVKYVNDPRNYHLKPNPNLPTHYSPALRNHENFSYGSGGITRPKTWTESSTRISAAASMGKYITPTEITLQMADRSMAQP